MKWVYLVSAKYYRNGKVDTGTIVACYTDKKQAVKEAEGLSQINFSFVTNKDETEPITYREKKHRAYIINGDVLAEWFDVKMLPLYEKDE